MILDSQAIEHLELLDKPN